MTSASGVEIAGEQPATEHGPAGDDDVTMTIRGQTAARMLTRGDAEARELREMVRALGERLSGIEAAATERAAEQVRLGQLIRALQDKVAQLAGQTGQQAAQLNAEFGRLGHELGEHGRRFGSVEREVGGLGAAVNELAAQVAAYSRASQPAADVGAQTSPDGTGDTQSGAGAGPAGSSRGLLAGAAARLRNLHLGLS